MESGHCRPEGPSVQCHSSVQIRHESFHLREQRLWHSQGADGRRPLNQRSVVNPTMAKDLVHSRGHRREPPAIINRLPLEDMRELWSWGTWKEPVPDGFDTWVTVVCTSRQKCLTYKGIQTHDYFLLDDESPEPTEEGIGQPVASGEDLSKGEGVEDLFDDGKPEGPPYERRFRLVSFERFVDELRQEVRRSRDITLLVNPRKSSTGEFTADAIWRAEAFLRERGTAVPAQRPR